MTNILSIVEEIETNHARILCCKNETEELYRVAKSMGFSRKAVGELIKARGQRPTLDLVKEPVTVADVILPS